MQERQYVGLVGRDVGVVVLMVSAKGVPIVIVGGLVIGYRGKAIYSALYWRYKRHSG